ncbi:MAG TPA: hypothetical protein VLS89_09485, partial [Candidatus Nanopelagicales bacterium]|nr:hypothetical protein [Candidatus Nanopelagicales bacterium]
VTGVAFGEAGMDANGVTWLETAPRLGSTISVRVSGVTADLLTVFPVDFPEDQVSSVFVVGNLDDVPQQLSLLVCSDLLEPQGNLATCQTFVQQ